MSDNEEPITYDYTDQKVHAIWYYWDGPRTGVADLGDQTVYYFSLFSESGEFSDLFLLWPISDDVLDLVKEDRAILHRWLKAKADGLISDNNSFGTLPGDETRQKELESLLEEALRIRPALCYEAIGHFRHDEQAKLQGAVWDEVMKVSWKIVRLPTSGF